MSGETSRKLISSLSNGENKDALQHGVLLSNGGPLCSQEAAKHSGEDSIGLL